jgi:hypothetical protein
MNFNFPVDKKTESVNISIYEVDINKIRALAKKYNCTHNDIYKTLISEALEEYEQQKGSILGEKAKPAFSVKRDYVEAGDNRRKEVQGEEPFDGGGDLRTKEAKNQLEETEWSALHDACVGCNTTERKHIGRGLCSKCYYHEKKVEQSQKVVKKLPKDWYKKENLEIKEDEPIKEDLPQKSKKQTIEERHIEMGKEKDEKIKSLVAFCQNEGCSKPENKYIKGTGIEYKILDTIYNFCSERCKVMFMEVDNRLGYEPISY